MALGTKAVGQMSLGIKMVDLHRQYYKMKREIDQAIQEVLNDSNFIGGPQVDQFAEHLSAYLGGVRVIPCANGTDALQIAMMALGFMPGDEVILPVHTYVATAEVIALLRLTPVFVDVDPITFNIDVSKIQAKITPRTKAIVPVHLYGQCAEMQPILELADRYSLSVVEDAAQSLGAAYHLHSNWAMAGTMGTVGTTSFFPSKTLGAFGDGGAIFTKDALLANKIKMIANHGQAIKYHHQLVGVNSRLDTLQAAILLVKLRYLDSMTASRNRLAELYDVGLRGMEDVVTPFRSPRSTHVFHQYTIKANRRDELKTFLQKRGIPSMIYYPIPLHLQEAYQHVGYKMGSFPVTEELSKRVLSLPIHSEMSVEEVTLVTTAIKEFYS